MAERIDRVGKLFNIEQLHELLYLTLETVQSAIRIYTVLARHADDSDHRLECQSHLDHLRNQRVVVEEMFDRLELDPETDTVFRRVRRCQVEILLDDLLCGDKTDEPAINRAAAREAVRICQYLLQQCWNLIGELASQCNGDVPKVLRAAHAEVAEQQDINWRETIARARNPVRPPGSNGTRSAENVRNAYPVAPRGDLPPAAAVLK